MKFLTTLVQSVKNNWKECLFCPLAIILVAFIARVYVFSDNKYPTQYHAEVVKPGYETQPAYYEVYVSPKQAWEQTHNTVGGKISSTLADLFFWGALIIGLLSTVDMVNIKKPLRVIVPLLVLWICFKYSTFSSALGNYVRVSADEYKKAKDSPQGVGVFFYGQHLH
jgi:hypothetical protein